MWKVFRKNKKWSKLKDQQLAQILESLIEELEKEKDEDEEDEVEVDEPEECSCSINDLMKKGCICGGI